MTTPQPLPSNVLTCSRCAAALIDAGIEIDWNGREVRQGGRVASFGPVQIDILAVLFRESPKWCRVERVIARVYGHTYTGRDPASTVRVLVHDIRRKLHASGIALAVQSNGSGHNHRGYRLMTPNQAPTEAPGAEVA